MGSIERRMFIVGTAASTIGSMMTSGTRAQEASPRATRTDQPIRIAVVTPVSGRAAGPFGLPGRNAAELLVEAINTGAELPAPYSSKGLAGRRLLLTVYDEAGSPSEQAELFRRIHANGAEVVVGYVGSGAAMAVAPVAEELRHLFKLVDAARVRLPSARLVLISGESGLSRLAASVPDGTVIGGRGSNGWLAPDTEMNRWFTASYRDRYEVAPIYPAYGMANALLGLKAAWDKAGPTAGPAEVASALAGSTFQGIGSTIAMTRANGRQAIAEAAYGTVRRKSVTGQIELVDVRRFPPDCVNPPDGVTALKWIESGFSGGRC